MKAQIYSYNDWIEETDPKKLFNTYDSKLKKAGFNVIEYQEKMFEPYGYTGLWLLGESHFAVHTFPEENRTYIELASCTLEKYVNFVKDL